MADLVLTFKSNYSTTANSIVNANKGLSKSLEDVRKKTEEYSKKVKALNSNLAKQKTEMTAMKKELKAAEKAFSECADAANEEALTEAYEKYENIKNTVSDTAKTLKETRTEMRKFNDEASKLGAGAGGGSNEMSVEVAQANLLKSLAKSGVFKSLSDSFGTYVGASLTSSLGANEANYATNILSGVVSGAAMGAAAGPWGALAGAVIGLASGVFSAASQEIKSKDEAFKTAVQENYDSAVAWRDGLREGGSDTAAQREKDMISFDTLLGGGGKDFIAALSEKAAETPMEYADLVTLSKTLATAFGHTPNDNTDVDIMSLVQAIGDAGAAVGLDASGLNMVATAMTRMQATNKATLEYLNLMQERGIDAIGMLADGLGTDKSKVYSMISKGEITGTEAVAILQEQMEKPENYGGSMQTQSQTFAGKQSTLSDMETNVGNAYGEGYNAIKGQGLDRQIGFYEGAAGKELQNAMEKWGAFEAEAENLQTDMTNAALTLALTGSKTDASRLGMDDEAISNLQALYQEYLKDTDGSEAGRIMAEAKAIAYSAYTQTETYKTIVDTELALIEGVQEATADGYWKAGWYLAEQKSKGYKAFEDQAGSAGSMSEETRNALIARSPYFQSHPEELHAYGLSRVPYDGYRAVLHQGERVLTASEARAMDRAGGGSAVVTGNTFVVREEADIGRIAEAIVEELAAAKLAYAG